MELYQMCVSANTHMTVIDAGGEGVLGGKWHMVV